MEAWLSKVNRVKKPGVFVDTPHGKVFVHPNKGRRYIKLKDGRLESFPKFLLSLDGVDIPKGTDIHHINEDKLDDRIENYEYSDHHDHARDHLNFKKVKKASPEEYSLDSDFIKNLIVNMSDSEIVLYDWDKLAFGFSNGEVVQFPIDKIWLYHTTDIVDENDSMLDYFKGKKLEELPPAKIMLKDGNFILEDGHHRYAYSKQMGLDYLTAEMDIRDNPFDYLGYYVDDVIRLRNKLQEDGTMEKGQVYSDFLGSDAVKLPFDYSQYGYADEKEFMEGMSGNFGVPMNELILLKRNLGSTYSPERLIEELQEYSINTYKMAKSKKDYLVNYAAFKDIDSFIESFEK
jgi:hypothetical protein